jgi:hypothetical protein
MLMRVFVLEAESLGIEEILVLDCCWNALAGK